MSLKNKELQILECIKEIGYLLMKNNAETYRIEESIHKMCEAYNFRHIEVFSISNYFSVSLMLSDNSLYFSSKRCNNAQTNLNSIYELNSLVRNICKTPMPVKEIKINLKKIKKNKSCNTLELIGYILGSSMFCGFFDGKIIEILISGFIGILVYLCEIIYKRLKINRIVATMCSSMLIAYIAVLSNRIHIITQIEPVIIGSIMLLVPGVAIANGVRDIIYKDFVSGTSKLMEAVFIALAIAIGVGLIV